ncbi:hypothetical protein EIP91_007241 [Steccherinum ochraceum]|uniref:F-box domain-containing protein n=1 Tax=Steccherinum ochraceum TaxID=92696 RepID=A0A4R0R726_9APHY|nr:hypothetical protein EIP91_007241 [Steccherinum ochraceum]
MSSTSRFSSLSPQLRHEIFGHLDKDGLSACSLLSKEHSKTAQELLLRSVTVRHWKEDTSTYVFTACLSTLSKRSPHKLKLIENLTITAVDPSPDSFPVPATVYVEDIALILAQLPALRSLKLLSVQIRDDLKTAQPQIVPRPLQVLTLEYTDFLIPRPIKPYVRCALFTLFSMFSSIGSLDFRKGVSFAPDGSRAGGPIGKLSANAPLVVREMAVTWFLYRGWMPDSDICDYLIEACRIQVADTLKITMDSERGKVFAKKFGRDVSRLEVTGPKSDENSDELWDHTEHCKALTTLVFGGRLNPMEDFFALDELIASAAESLTHVTLCWPYSHKRSSREKVEMLVDQKWANVDSALSQFEKLARVEILCEYDETIREADGEDDEDEEWSEDDDGEKADARDAHGSSTVKTLFSMKGALDRILSQMPLLRARNIVILRVNPS